METELDLVTGFTEAQQRQKSVITVHHMHCY